MVWRWLWAPQGTPRGPAEGLQTRTKFDPSNLKASAGRGVRPPHSRLPLRLGRSGDAWPAGMPPRGPSLYLPRGAKCNEGLLIGGGGPSGPPIAGTSSPALRGGAGGGLSAHLALPVVMPSSLEGGSLGLAPSGAGLAGPLCHTPDGGGPFQLGLRPRVPGCLPRLRGASPAP